MLSTFGIDSRKKLCIGSLDSSVTNSEINKYWLYGDIEPKNLNSIKLEYKEHFTNAVDDYNKTYNDLTANLRNKLNTLIKNTGKIVRGNVKGDDIADPPGGKSNSTRATLMELSAMISELTGDSCIEDQFGELYSIAPKYHIPQRESPPSISLPISDLNNGLTVNFAFGKVGLFDAKLEVWDPIKNIINNLTPKPTSYLYSFNENENEKVIDTGLYKFDGLKTIPFQISSKYRFYKRIKENHRDVRKDLVGSFEKIANTENNQNLKDFTTDLEKSNNLFGSITDVLSTTKNIKISDKKSRKQDDEILKLEDRLSDVRNTKNNAKKSKDIIKLDKEINDLETKIANKKEKSRTGIFSSLNYIISQLATLDTKFIGAAAKSDYDSLKNNILPIQIGFIPKDSTKDGFIIYGLNEDNIATRFSENYKPLITVEGIIEDLSCDFDFSNVDERGYPMKGSISINKVWAVNTFGKNVIFS